MPKGSCTIAAKTTPPRLHIDSRLCDTWLSGLYWMALTFNRSRPTCIILPGVMNDQITKLLIKLQKQSELKPGKLTTHVTNSQLIPYIK